MTRAKRSKATGKRKHEEVEAKPKPQVAKWNREEVVKNEKPKEDGEVKEDGAKVEAESELKEQDGTFIHSTHLFDQYSLPQNQVSLTDKHRIRTTLQDRQDRA